MKILHNENGQAMVEFTIVSIALVILLTAILYISDAYIIKHKTIIAARYGTWQMAHNFDAEKGKVEKEIGNFFFPARKSNITFTDVSKDSDTQVEGKLNALLKEFVAFSHGIMASDSGHTPLQAKFEVRYEKKLKLTPLLASYGLPSTLKIQSSHQVDGNTWHFSNTKVHELIKFIFEGWDELMELL